MTGAGEGAALVLRLITADTSEAERSVAYRWQTVSGMEAPDSKGRDDDVVRPFALT